MKDKLLVGIVFVMGLMLIGFGEIYLWIVEVDVDVCKFDGMCYMVVDLCEL